MYGVIAHFPISIPSSLLIHGVLLFTDTDIHPQIIIIILLYTSIGLEASTGLLSLCLLHVIRVRIATKRHVNGNDNVWDDCTLNDLFVGNITSHNNSDDCSSNNNNNILDKK
jgi:hypothetical protein